jgi:hypothetical protein
MIRIIKKMMNPGLPWLSADNHCVLCWFLEVLSLGSWKNRLDAGDRMIFMIRTSFPISGMEIQDMDGTSEKRLPQNVMVTQCQSHFFSLSPFNGYRVYQIFRQTQL